ncbi:MAG: hypothetical protein EB015_01120 [Methylocystaceae bacterium]|nr:hypothetical protein [Methylocystaceae bacterium]
MDKLAQRLKRWGYCVIVRRICARIGLQLSIGWISQNLARTCFGIYDYVWPLGQPAPEELGVSGSRPFDLDY